jgi:heme exporter protein B
MSKPGVWRALVRRDLRLARRRVVESLLPVVFFVVVTSLFPIGVGPEPDNLREMAAGVVWVCALLAAMLSLGSLYASDYADGSLEQMLIAPVSLYEVTMAKALSHWLASGLPLLLVSPLIALLFGMTGESIGVLMLGLLLGTPVLSFLGGLGAALTLGLRSSGVLMLLLVLPLCVPVLIFGTGAVSAVQAGVSAQGHFSLLGALLLLTGMGAPLATAAALKIAHA